MMLHIPGVLSRGDAERLRQAVDAAEWVDGRQTVGAQGARVKQNRQLPENDPNTRALGQGVLEAVRRSPLFMAAALPLRFSDPLFNRYESGETYGLHVDGSVRLASSGHVRTDLSCTLFLADPETYDGGELEVVDTYGVHEVKLPAGDAILYPSTSLHRVTPVTRGARVASFFWLQSLVRDDGARGLLFDMDKSIQALRAKHGDSEEAVALTGVYHNLLRRWAET
ncbi:MAG: Fe2+-dependent dioxygenase [Caulobacterales bacterium 68-7]|nr:MAG: Fe2+-dependent dioxygenase [Caulobacterales bacterium 68-7]